MVTNLFFNNFNFTSEQRLVEDLIIEAIQIYGIECYYLPRTLVKEDNLFGEDILSKFDTAFALEMYIKNVEGFDGEGDFLSKFNIEIRDEITFTISQRRFSEEIHPSDTTPYNEDQGIGRPSEGDLIYFPLNGKIFEVKFVEHEAVFYQLGSLQTYDLRCELFEYSSERLDTGIPQIDAIETTLSVDALLYQVLFETYTTAAIVEATVAGGIVTALTIESGGQDYVAANTTVTIDSPARVSGDAVAANGVGTIVDGRLTDFTITVPGGFYTNAPSVSFARPNINYFVNAAAQTITNSNTNVTSITVTEGGFFYGEAPAVEFPEPAATDISSAIFDTNDPKIGNTSIRVEQEFFSFTQNFTEANLQYGTVEVFVKPDNGSNTNGSNTGLILSTNSYSIGIANGILELKSSDGSVNVKTSNGSIIGSVKFANGTFSNVESYTHVLLEANSSHTLVFQDGVNVINVATDNSSRPLVSGRVALGDFDAQSNGIVGLYDGLKISNTSSERVSGDIYAIKYPVNTTKTSPQFNLTITNGVITAVEIANTGSYFANTPTLTVSAPGVYNFLEERITFFANGSIANTFTVPNTAIAFANATANATISDRLISGVSISNTGFYYSSAPAVSLTGGGAPEFKFGNSSEKLPSSQQTLFTSDTSLSNSSIDFWLYVNEAPTERNVTITANTHTELFLSNTTVEIIVGTNDSGVYDIPVEGAANVFFIASEYISGNPDGSNIFEDIIVVGYPSGNTSNNLNVYRKKEYFAANNIQIIFNQSSNTNIGHPLVFKFANGLPYTSNVVTFGTPGTAGAQTVLTTPSTNADIVYYCNTHGVSMGNTIYVRTDAQIGQSNVYYDAANTPLTSYIRTNQHILSEFTNTQNQTIISGNNFNISIASTENENEFNLIYYNVDKNTNKLRTISPETSIEIVGGNFATVNEGFTVNEWHHIQLNSYVDDNGNENIVFGVDGTRYYSGSSFGNSYPLISDEKVYSIGPRQLQNNTSITFGQANAYIDALHFANTRITTPNSELSTYTIPTSEYSGGQYTNNFNYTAGTLLAQITNGKVSAVNIINSGNNYYEAPTITIAAPNTELYTTANIQVATLEDGGIASVTIVDGGFGYVTDAENTGLDLVDVTLTASNTNVDWYEANTTYYSSDNYYAQVFVPYKATGTANVNSDGTVNVITLSNTGFGYASGQELIIAQANTVLYNAANATATINANGQVTGITITDPGLGYANADVLFPFFTPPIYNTAEASVTITAGIITDITITDAGSGYRTAPKVRVVGNQQAGALLSEDGGSVVLDAGQIGYKPENTDRAANNEVFEVHDFIDFSESNPFSEGDDW
jgi:hypothetical protein